jgi:hypothetical protein
MVDLAEISVSAPAGPGRITVFRPSNPTASDQEQNQYCQETPIYPTHECKTSEAIKGSDATAVSELRIQGTAVGDIHHVDL